MCHCKLSLLYNEYQSLVKEKSGNKTESFYQKQLMMLDRISFDVNSKLYYLYQNEVQKNKKLENDHVDCINKKEYESLLGDYHYLLEKYNSFFTDNKNELCHEILLKNKQLTLMSTILNKSDHSDLKKDLIKVTNDYNRLILLKEVDDLKLKNIESNMNYVHELEAKIKELLILPQKTIAHDTVELQNKINELEYSNNKCNDLLI